MSHLIVYLIGMTWICLSLACSSTRHVPQPIVDLGDGSVPIESAIVSQDLQTCRTEVHQAAPVSMQPRWLPPLGTSANGVVLGTADTPHAVWLSHEDYRQAIEHCLTDRGYRVRGWQ
ncbi:protein of unknown function [Nitrospira japonica]|uniref:Uncharacterized protein n=1 Tax=Nitrospira japonica TaxID=1325564 RepID=A0A1W1I4S7_9BACT|nr:hypothetical protein [Nitrospira japonica]SLM47823.1 protein of unknown function [Nitrospira japonica]